MILYRNAKCFFVEKFLVHYAKNMKILILRRNVPLGERMCIVYILKPENVRDKRFIFLVGVMSKVGLRYKKNLILMLRCKLLYFYYFCGIIIVRISTFR